MSLRKKDDWDVALEEANRNKKVDSPFVASHGYDYGMTYRINKSKLLATENAATVLPEKPK